MQFQGDSTNTPLSRSVVFLESFYGGSHREFADCFAEYSRHKVDVLTLPDRHWGWRMRWSAQLFAQQLLKRPRYELIVATDLINLADLTAILSRRGYHVPVLLYMHENQLAYPRSDAKPPPLEHALTDIKNVLIADRTLFNSAFHRDTFLSAADSVLKGIPEFDTQVESQRLRDTSTVMYPGIEHNFGTHNAESADSDTELGSGPVILWNHRWEPDKQPHIFRRALEKLHEQGMAFRLILLGEHALGEQSGPNEQSGPKWKPNPDFEALCAQFGSRVIYAGYAQDRAEYFRLLQQGDIVMSTAVQENFGLSMLQAIDAGCWPLAPTRLAYPEILPAEVHEDCLYNGTKELIRKTVRLGAARRALQGTQGPQGPQSAQAMQLEPKWERLRRTLSERAAEFHWERRIQEYDRLIETVVLDYESRPFKR